MKKIHRAKNSCELCGKTAQFGFNRPKSLHKTSRVILPNLQKWNGLLICNRCRKSLKKFAVIA
ncbi:50S ribosomal protein L28 [Candidatus Berkelbacteria bacterium]|nr:50S ribosomal protein L28 [Candidatus Berkelbacteria bacterium]